MVSRATEPEIKFQAPPLSPAPGIQKCLAPVPAPTSKCFGFRPGPSPDLAAGGPKTRRRGGKNQKGGPHFYNTVLDVCSNWGPNVKWGGTDFKWGGRAPLAPPLATALVPAPK